MKTIIAGSRDLEIFSDQYPIWVVADAVMKSKFHITEVVSGGARGVDIAGVIYAESLIPPIPVRKFIPDWDKLGKSAGPARNEEMARYAEALILIWNGWSRGSADMLKRAQNHNLVISQYITK